MQLREEDILSEDAAAQAAQDAEGQLVASIYKRIRGPEVALRSMNEVNGFPFQT